MDFHEWLKAKGFDPTTLGDAQRDVLLSAFKAEQALAAGPGGAGPGAGTVTPPAAGANGNGIANNNGGSNDTAADITSALAPMRLRQQRQTDRVALIAKYAERNPGRLDAIEQTGRLAASGDWPSDRLELELLRLCGSYTSIDNGGRSAIESIPAGRVFEAGLCLAGKLANVDKAFDAQTLEAADRKWRTGLGLGELLLTAAKANGFGGLSHRDVGPLLRAAFPGEGNLRAGGPSTFDVSSVLANVANKFLVQYFNAVDNTWQLIAKTRPVNDFKQVTSYSLTGDFEYKQVAPGGELQHGTLGAQSYANQADTFGRMFAIDRRDIINDDLGAFMQVLTRLGRGGALKLNDIFWSIFLNNATFFTTGRNNYAAGADTALSIASLEAAEAAFANQTDPDGKPVAVNPALLVVPPVLKRTALRLMNSTEVRELPDTTSTGAAAKAYGTANTFEGDFRIASSPYMSNSKYTGYSSTAWYLLANPNELPVVEACFLNGVERPTVESAQADFDTLGVKMRGYFDFGVALQEYRGGVKRKGIA